MRRFALVTLVSVFLSLFLAFQGASAQEGVRIVMLLTHMGGGQGGSVATQIPHEVRPYLLSINPGTVVVWVNQGAYRATVSFAEGKACQLATGSPCGGFTLGKKSHCFQTIIMGNGGTASLRFLQKGLYNYKVFWGREPKPSMAKIVVQ